MSILYFGEGMQIDYIDGTDPETSWYAFHDVVIEIWKHFHLFKEMRPWQAIFNVLSVGKQEGMPTSWPELFYATDSPFEHGGRGHTEFFTRFEIIDGYIVPKNA